MLILKLIYFFSDNSFCAKYCIYQFYLFQINFSLTKITHENQLDLRGFCFGGGEAQPLKSTT